MRPNEEHFWRTSHVLLVFFIYIALLLIFFVIEKLLFGGEVVDVDYKNPGTFLFEELVIAGVMIVVPLLVVRYTYHASLEEIGISSNRIAEYLIIGIIAGIFIWIATSVVDFGVENIIEKGDVNPYMRSLRSADSYLSYSVILGSIVLLGPISEEVYFR